MVEGHTDMVAHLVVVITVDLKLVAMEITSVQGEPRPLLNVSTPVHNMLLEILSMNPHTLVTEIMFTLWTEVLGFSVEIIFFTFRTTKVMDQIRSFINGGASKSHFLMSCLPSKLSIINTIHITK